MTGQAEALAPIPDKKIRARTAEGRRATRVA
jgi:hypothetical protein